MGQVAQPAQVLRHVKHHRFPITAVEAILDEADAIGPWVLFDPTAAFTLNYLAMVPGLDAILVFLTDTDIQANGGR